MRASGGTSKPKSGRRARQDRVRQAPERLPELEAKKKPQEKDQARASTTDPEATVMQRADGGFRPAYNVPCSTDTRSQIIVGVEVTTSGSDQGELVPRVEQVQERFAQRPQEVLVDGGFAAHGAIEAVSAPDKGCVVYAPVPKPPKEGADRQPPYAGDSPAVAAWRARMATAAQAVYTKRAATAECVNAQARNRGWRQWTVRGRLKAQAVALWSAVAHNLMRAVSLRAARLAQVGEVARSRTRQRAERLEERSSRLRRAARTSPISCYLCSPIVPRKEL